MTKTILPIESICFTAEQIRQAQQGLYSQTRFVLPRRLPASTVTVFEKSGTFYAGAVDPNSIDAAIIGYVSDGKPATEYLPETGSMAGAAALRFIPHPEAPEGFLCPYPDTIKVKEPFAHVHGRAQGKGILKYRAGLEHMGYRWKPAMHMRPTDCRHALQVTRRAVKRLDDISPRDAMRCIGQNGLSDAEAIEAYRARFKYSDPAPWAWVIDFIFISTK